MSGSPVLSPQITQESGWLFLPPNLLRQKAPGDNASSAAAVCGFERLCYLPPAASRLTGSFPSVFHHRKFPVGKHLVSKQRVPWYKREVHTHTAVRKKNKNNTKKYRWSSLCKGARSQGLNYVRRTVLPEILGLRDHQTKPLRSSLAH